MDKDTLIARAGTLTGLHARHRPLVLPTVWDAWSAQTAVETGFEALTIGSHPLADSRGAADHEGQTFTEVIEAIRPIIAAVDVPGRSPDGEPGDRGLHLPALAGRYRQDETVTAAHAQERLWLTVPAGAEPPFVLDDLDRRPGWPRPEPSLQVQLEEGGRRRADATCRWPHAP